MGISLALGETGGFWVSLFVVGELGGLTDTSLSLFIVRHVLSLGDCVSSFRRFAVSSVVVLILLFRGGLESSVVVLEVYLEV